MTLATGGGLACAIHAIGDLANTYALDAFAVTGARGTIEHAQLVSHADIPRFGRLGVTASVQPEHAIDDRDITDTIWAGQTALPYPLASLAGTGANLVFGSDAPVSPLDPWAALAAAVHRTRDGREPWHPDQALGMSTALAASTHLGSSNPSVIAPGALADLVVCESDPLRGGRERPEIDAGCRDAARRACDAHRVSAGHPEHDETPGHVPGGFGCVCGSQPAR